MKVGGYRARHIKQCGFKGSSVFTASELKADGFGVKELLHDEGMTLNQVGAAFSVAEMRGDGVTAEQLLTEGYTLAQMREGGFDAAGLFKAGYAVHDMKKAGFM